MKIIYFVIMFCHKISGKLTEIEKIEYCRTLQCDETVGRKVCGMRKENGVNTYKLFQNECLLLKYGCQVDDDSTYGIINIQHCSEQISEENEKNSCPECLTVDHTPVCGIRKDGNGFIVRIFASECQLTRFNCQQQLQFDITDFYICAKDKNRRTIPDDSYKDNTELPQKIAEATEELDEGITETINPIDGTTAVGPQEMKNTNNLKQIVVVGGSMADMLKINRTVENFFAATHVLDLPVREMKPDVNENTRRMLIRIFGPVKVFTPWLKIPKNITEDHYHNPTLSSCFHKCPTKCPDTYAPVCGVPGIVAREPSLMFQNHCFMDVAQCKMFWEDKSWTAESSAYIESSFLFCLGDELNGLYRFLPFIRTLQHMGRLKKKGRFRYKLKNMRFFNQLMNRQPNIMGR